MAIEEIYLRSVHVHGFRSPRVLPDRLRECLSEHGCIEDVFLWTSVTEKQHAFVVFADCDGADRAAGSSHSFQTENIRNNLSMQGLLRAIIQGRVKRPAEDLRPLDYTRNAPLARADSDFYGRGLRSSMIDDEPRHSRLGVRMSSRIGKVNSASFSRRDYAHDGQSPSVKIEQPTLSARSPSFMGRPYCSSRRVSEARRHSGERGFNATDRAHSSRGDPNHSDPHESLSRASTRNLDYRGPPNMPPDLSQSFSGHFPSFPDQDLSIFHGGASGKTSVSHVHSLPPVHFGSPPSPSPTQHDHVKDSLASNDVTATSSAAKAYSVGEVLQTIRGAYQDDPVEAHRRSCLLVIEYGNKGMFDFAEAVGNESISLAGCPDLAESRVLCMKPIYLALATVKSKRAKAANGRERELLMQAAANYITLAEAEDRPPSSLNIVRLGLLNSDGAKSSAHASSSHKSTSASSLVCSSSLASESKELSSPILIKAYEQQPARDTRFLRAQINFLESLFTRISGEVKSSKRHADEDADHERKKRRKLQDELDRAVEEKKQLDIALEDERSRRQKAEDEIWKIKKAQTLSVSRSSSRRRS